MESVARWDPTPSAGGVTAHIASLVDLSLYHGMHSSIYDELILISHAGSCLGDNGGADDIRQRTVHTE